MEASLTELLVLGHIPGTHVYLSFWHFVGAGIVIGSFMIGYVGMLAARSGLKRFNPFYGAPRSIHKNDLFSL